MDDQENTVGKNFRPGEFKVYSIELNTSDRTEMRFYKQKAMDFLRSKGYDLVNVRRAMNKKDFQRMEKMEK